MVCRQFLQRLERRSLPLASFFSIRTRNKSSALSVVPPSPVGCFGRKLSHQIISSPLSTTRLRHQRHSTALSNTAASPQHSNSSAVASCAPATSWTPSSATGHDGGPSVPQIGPDQMIIFSAGSMSQRRHECSAASSGTAAVSRLHVPDPTTKYIDHEISPKGRRTDTATQSDVDQLRIRRRARLPCFLRDPNEKMHP